MTDQNPLGETCDCVSVAMGSYDAQVELVAPEWSVRSDGRGICVDACLALEITNLWKAGIQTTGCCCGHNSAPPYIGVFPAHIEQMKALGYTVQPNASRPRDEDSFVPKCRRAHRPVEQEAFDFGNALFDAYMAGATDTHNHWVENPGEAPRGDPEFAEAARDYADSVPPPSAASPPSRALSQDEREACDRVRQFAKFWDQRDGDGEPIAEPHEHHSESDGLTNDVATLLNILQPEGQS